MPKLLLIEDDSLMIRMYQRKFEYVGFELQTALNGEDGLVKVKEFMPDLVLLDIMMPKMNGLEVLKALKADPEEEIRNIPVVLLTNLGGSQDDVDKGLELGAVAYLVKSIGFNIVKATEPNPGKIVFYLEKSKQNRTKILLPPGIGDIYWVLTKLESFLEINNIDLPDIYIQEQGVKNRGLAFIEKFPFLNSKQYQKFPNGRPHQFTEA